MSIVSLVTVGGKRDPQRVASSSDGSAASRKAHTTPLRSVARAALAPADLCDWMPERIDLQSILILGTGPIVIGQAADFDYSGTPAMRSLREGVPRDPGQQ